MAKTLRQTLADHIKGQMAARPGMTITSLAKLAGISRGQLNNIVTQSTDTKLDTLESIAKVFGIEPWSLLVRPSLDNPKDFNEAVVQFAQDRRQLFRVKDAAQSEPPPIEDMPEVLYSPTDITVGAGVLLDVFHGADDEARLALLRLALSLEGWIPNLEGWKLPRDWRAMLYDWAVEVGAVEVEPSTWEQLLNPLRTKKASTKESRPASEGGGKGKKS